MNVNPHLYTIIPDDFSKTLVWWQYTEERRAYNSLYFSEASIHQTKRKAKQLFIIIEATTDPAKKISLSVEYVNLKASLKMQKAIFKNILNHKTSEVSHQTSKKGVDLVKKLEKLKESFHESLEKHLEPLHHSISLFLLFRLFIKDRLELYAKYHPYDNSFHEQSKKVIVQLCDLRCSSDNTKVQSVIDSCMNFVETLESALVEADAQMQTESKIWNFWKEIIQEPEFFDFKVFNFLDQTPHLISLKGIVNLCTAIYQQLLEDIPMIKDIVIPLLDSCHQGLEVKEYLGCPLEKGVLIKKPEELKQAYIAQLDIVYALVSHFMSQSQISSKEIILFYKELEEALAVFPALFLNMRYLLEFAQKMDKEERKAAAIKYGCENDLEGKKFHNLEVYQQIHHINDSLLNFLHYQIEGYINALKTEKVKAKNLPPTPITNDNFSMSPQLKGAYSRTLYHPELGQKIQQFRYLYRQRNTECSKHTNLYLGYIQGLLSSRIELTNYRSFVHTSVLLLESCYYALEQAAGDLSEKKLDFHGLVGRYKSLGITDPLLKELNFVPHWIHYLYEETSSFQSITTIRNLQKPFLLTDLHTCLEVTQQQSADKLLEKAIDYVRRTLTFIMECSSLNPKEETKIEQEVLNEVEHPIPSLPFLNLRLSLPEAVSPDEKIYHQQMNLTLDLFTQSLNLLNRTNDPSLFAALVQKSTETLYRYFKQSLLLLHLKKFQRRGSKESSVVELYKLCIGADKRVNELFAQFGSSGRYPYSIITSTCRLHALQKEAITLMETPSLDHGFAPTKGLQIRSNQTREKLNIAYQDALEILTKQILPLLKN